ncbi:DNA repair protein RadC [Prolixibacteraceae bacterium JC049]|nr:DNA repair protein RadC [Prolixibacteraceae bacterium JC049]
MKEYNKLSIKQWSVEDRPREKAFYKGIRSLSNAELIAILLSSGNSNESAVELSKRILKSYDNSLNLIAQCTIKDLMQFNGIGTAKAINILAAMELGKRRKMQTNNELPKIGESADAMEQLAPLLLDLAHEEFWVLYLDRANQVKQQYQLSRGGISGTIVDIRLILRKALEIGCSAIILGHNHPSGNINPSDADITITNKIAQAAKLMDIKLLDHIIVAGKDYYSFSDNALI